MTSDLSPYFAPDMLFAAASLYYLDDLNQAVIAERLGTSRATVSRMLAEARRTGMVRIEVIPVESTNTDDLAARTAAALGLDAIHLVATAPPAMALSTLGPALSTALDQVGLRAGDVLLISSGRTVYEVTQGQLPALPGVELAPMIGGQNEPQPWYQTNEIVRQFADKVGGHPTFLHAPALPGAELHATLMTDRDIERVLTMWRTARCAVLGVGPPPLSRQSIPDFVPLDATTMHEAVGDVCSRFYDHEGTEVWFPGVDRLMSTPLPAIRDIPVTIAVAVGAEKVQGLLAGARAGYFTQLVTDVATATALTAAAHDAEAIRS